VAADFLTMNYHDAFGLPGVVTRMFNNYGPRQNPRYVTGTIVTQALERPVVELGQLDPMRDFCFCTDGVRGHLTVAAQGIPGDVYVYGQGENISMADWSDLIIRTGVEHGFWPDDRQVVTTERATARRERGDGAPRRLREAQPRDRLGAEDELGRGDPAHHPLVRREPRPVDRPRRLAERERAAK
jgi:nucleoside-diphosphate-sugar epimerase